MCRLLVAFCLAAAFTQAQQPHEDLSRLFAGYDASRLQESPESGTARGLVQFNNRWTDWSVPAIERRARQRVEFLNRLRPLMTASLPEQDQLSVRFLLYILERESETATYDVYVRRMSQLFGAHTAVFSTFDQMPRNTIRDYENIIARLQALPAYVDQHIAIFTEAIARGLVQPAVVVERVQAQLRTQLSQTASQSDLLNALRQWPASIPAPERARLTTQANAAFNTSFLPAWRKLSSFVDQTYLPKARPSIAFTSVPDGQRLYAAQVRAMTTTALTPEEIHQQGKVEVARLEKEMLAVARESGATGALGEIEQRLAESPEQQFRSKEEMLAYCRNIAKVVEPELPKLFKRIPRLLYGIRAIPEAVEASTASNAQSPSPDGSRPGWFNLNTYEPQKQVKYNKEALVLHEAVPGHIFQGSLALEQADLPAFRRGGSLLSAYAEGWALYAESLGSELGVYRDPLSRLGRLSSERFRAVRLVVDTGMHAMGWSRAQAVDYFSTHAPSNSISEIDRYIAWPGQALSYKMGQLAITEMRRRAERDLGARFDVRDFHDVILRNGALPMELLSQVVDSYIAGVQAKQ